MFQSDDRDGDDDCSAAERPATDTITTKAIHRTFSSILLPLLLSLLLLLIDDYAHRVVAAVHELLTVEQNTTRDDG